MHCHLLLPDLFWPAHDAPDIYAGLDTPALERLLARGRARVEAQAAEAGSSLVWLCERFGVDKQEDWPVAPYSLLADGGEPGTQHWLRADPVHLKLVGNRLVLADSGSFPLSQLETDSLAASLNAHFSGDGLMFHALRPERWYVRVGRAPSMQTTPLAQAVGRSIDDILPRGADAPFWRARLNEVQMLLHGHAVNAHRETRANCRSTASGCGAAAACRRRRARRSMRSGPRIRLPGAWRKPPTLPRTNFPGTRLNYCAPAPAQGSS